MRAQRSNTSIKLDFELKEKHTFKMAQFACHRIHVFVILGTIVSYSFSFRCLFLHSQENVFYVCLADFTKDETNEMPTNHVPSMKSHGFVFMCYTLLDAIDAIPYYVVVVAVAATLLLLHKFISIIIITIIIMKRKLLMRTSMKE